MGWDKGVELGMGWGYVQGRGYVHGVELGAGGGVGAEGWG